MKTIINFLISGLAVALAAYIIPWVVVDSYWTAIVVAVVLAIVNATIGLVLRAVAFPINFLSLGIVGFIISVLMILLVDSLVDGFATNGFFAAAIFAIVLGLIQGLFGSMERKA